MLQWGSEVKYTIRKLLQLYNKSKALESDYTKILYQATMAIKWKINEEKYMWSFKELMKADDTKYLSTHLKIFRGSLEKWIK